MIDKADLDHDGMISEEEFYLIITRRGTNHWSEFKILCFLFIFIYDTDLS